ncbi:MAG: hypothetical protein RJA57_3 [Bacteroidota bacterium]|jgi:hypothetical protein
MKRSLFATLLTLTLMAARGQYHWKLERQQKGISVYLSDIPGRSYKAVRVECTVAGTYPKLIAILSDVSGFPDWIYRNKKAVLVKRYTPLDFVYFSEISMPFPVSNRDLAIRMQIRTDSLPRFLTIVGSHQPDMVPEIPGHVRVPYYRAWWKVTMPEPGSLHISYIIQVDAGGSLPAWLSNSFADKGPYETFVSLAERLRD